MVLSLQELRDENYRQIAIASRIFADPLTRDDFPLPLLTDILPGNILNSTPLDPSPRNYTISTNPDDDIQLIILENDRSHTNSPPELSSRDITQL